MIKQCLITLFFSVCLFVCVPQLVAQSTQPSTQPTSQPTTQKMHKSKNMTKAPYHSIGEYPNNFTPATSVQRFIDGLGYRYYWASEGLREEDLSYSPGNDGITTFETLQHIFGLSRTIVTTVKGLDNVRPAPENNMTYDELRRATLDNIKEASNYLNQHPDLDFDKVDLVFARGERRSEYPFWNLLNGPILDAVYHTGQVVSFRRTSGNPVHPKMNVFSGKAPY